MWQVALHTVQLLWQAAEDPRVVGLFVDIGDESAGLARVQELRQAIAHFRGKGKFAIGFAESLGSGGTHFADYYLASALEQIWLQPSGGFTVAGIAIETPFIKGGLDKLGVQVEGTQYVFLEEVRKGIGRWEQLRTLAAVALWLA